MKNDEVNAMTHAPRCVPSRRSMRTNAFNSIFKQLKWRHQTEKHTHPIPANVPQRDEVYINEPTYFLTIFGHANVVYIEV